MNCKTGYYHPKRDPQLCVPLLGPGYDADNSTDGSNSCQPHLLILSEDNICCQDKGWIGHRCQKCIAAATSVGNRGMCARCKNPFTGLSCEQCDVGYYRVGENCVPLKDDGVVCTADGQCKSKKCRGHCCAGDVTTLLNAKNECISCTASKGDCGVCAHFSTVRGKRCQDLVPQRPGSPCTSDNACRSGRCGAYAGKQGFCCAEPFDVRCAVCSTDGMCRQCDNSRDQTLVDNRCMSKCVDPDTGRSDIAHGTRTTGSVRFLKAHVTGRVGCKREQQHWLCNDGKLEDCKTSDGDSCTYMQQTCHAGCDSLHVNEYHERTRYEKDSVPPGSKCKKQTQRQYCVADRLLRKGDEISSADGVLEDWTSVDVTDKILYTYPICGVRCAIGCYPHMLTDDKCQEECNNMACSFDNGACARYLQSRFDHARLQGLKRDVRGALQILQEIDKFAATDELAQAQIRRASETAIGALNDGLDLSGRAKNHLWPLSVEEYTKVTNPLVDELEMLEGVLQKTERADQDVERFVILEKSLALLALQNQHVTQKVTSVLDGMKHLRDGQAKLSTIAKNLATESRAQFDRILSGFDAVALQNEDITNLIKQVGKEIMQHDTALADQLEQTVKQEGKRLEKVIGSDIASVAENTRVFLTKGFESATRQRHDVKNILEGKLDDNAEGIRGLTKGQKHINNRIKDMQKQLKKIGKTVASLRDSLAANRKQMSGYAKQASSIAETIRTTIVSAEGHFSKFDTHGWDTNGNGMIEPGEILEFVYDLGGIDEEISDVSKGATVLVEAFVEMLRREASKQAQNHTHVQEIRVELNKIKRYVEQVDYFAARALFEYIKGLDMLDPNNDGHVDASEVLEVLLDNRLVLHAVVDSFILPIQDAREKNRAAARSLSDKVEGNLRKGVKILMSTTTQQWDEKHDKHTNIYRYTHIHTR